MSSNIQQSEKSIKMGLNLEEGLNLEKALFFQKNMQNIFRCKFDNFIPNDAVDQYSTKKQAVHGKYPKISTGIPTDQSSLEYILDNKDANLLPNDTVDEETSKVLTSSVLNNTFIIGKPSIHKRPLRH